MARPLTGMRTWTIQWRVAVSGTKGVTEVRATSIEGALSKFYETFTKAVPIIINTITDGSEP